MGNARHPGPASNWLKTYVLITFINGTMGSIDVIQNVLLQNMPLFMAAFPMKVNLMHAVQIMIPGVSFLGAYCGWQHFKVQRQVAMQRYQQQLQMMMQQPPLPPSALPFPAPGLALTHVPEGFAPMPMGWPGAQPGHCQATCCPTSPGTGAAPAPSPIAVPCFSGAVTTTEAADEEGSLRASQQPTK